MQVLVQAQVQVQGQVAKITHTRRRAKRGGNIEFISGNKFLEIYFWKGPSTKDQGPRTLILDPLRPRMSILEELWT